MPVGVLPLDPATAARSVTGCPNADGLADDDRDVDVATAFDDDELLVFDVVLSVGVVVAGMVEFVDVFDTVGVELSVELVVVEPIVDAERRLAEAVELTVGIENENVAAGFEGELLLNLARGLLGSVKVSPSPCGVIGVPRLAGTPPMGLGDTGVGGVKALVDPVPVGPGCVAEGEDAPVLFPEGVLPVFELPGVLFELPAVVPVGVDAGEADPLLVPA